ncbi:serine/threonine dehydratase [Gordonia spumicola]|uniref:threonine ammonia-lyase n=1 Tax=Gordonia spumicola TaxID=589161 RepID=A0A7I9VCC3_9ACTN|nr:threonine/serine dehydratase [Gordonia spumicola]GEE03029.1 serine/threonine dehydratase [Gordonia spumicola]
MITADDVRIAQHRIADRVRRTPMIQADRGPSGGDVWFKAEFLQRCGVFKTRGAFNRQLHARELGLLDPTVGVVAASGGNAGLANAYAASVLGVPATVFVPETAPRVKVDRLSAFGATVRQVGREYAEAYDAAQAHVASTGALFCHAYDQPEIAAGAGTLALEIIDDLAGVDTIVVAVGGGGLFAGVAALAHEHGVRVVAVEPERIPTLRSALDAGAPVDVDVSGVAADSLGARRIGDIALAVAAVTDPISVLVSDDDIVRSRSSLWADYRIPAEHGAAAAVAALDGGAYRPASGERIAVVVCGANTDVSTL